MSQVELIDLAAAIADGTPIDWATLEAGNYPDELRVRARIVERIAHLHAALPPAATFSSSLHKSLLNLSDEAIVASETPVTWGPLTIVEQIGRGTYGEVFRAHDPRLQRDVALKLLRRKDRRESAVIEEGHLMARVRHPNVVTVYGAERIDGRVGLWMEFVDGKTLEQELQERGPFAANEIIKIGIALCGALGAVHRAGLVHRDLKAQNVMRDADGRVLLTDFGAGRDASDADENTGGTELAGTPLYLAPEVLDGQPASPQSDLYSLGVLLFRLGTHAFPVEGRTIVELRRSHAARSQVGVVDRAEHLPRRLRAAIERALSHDPTKRFAGATEMAAALVVSMKARRRPLVAATTVALLGTAILAVGVPMMPRSRSTEIELTQLTFNSIEVPVRAAAISPDGQRLAYVDDQGLVIRSVSAPSGGAQQRVTLPPGLAVIDVGWFPDSHGLMLSGADGLWRTSSSGAEARRVSAGGLIAVSPDGSRIAVTNRERSAIEIVTANGEPVTRIVPMTPGSTVSRSAWSPDGGRIAYATTRQARGIRMTIETRRGDGSEPTTVVDDGGHIDADTLMWAADGRILFSRPEAPPKARYSNLWQVRVDQLSGRVIDEPLQITHVADFSFRRPSLTADGKRLAFRVDRHRGDVVVGDFDADRVELRDIRRAVFHGEDNLPTSWTPTGEAILFQQSNRGRFGIFRQRLDERDAREFIVVPDTDVAPAVFSPDTNWIYYLANTRRGIMRMPAGGGTAEEIHLGVPRANAWLKCSRLPANVCILTAISGGRLRVLPFDGSQAQPWTAMDLPAPPTEQSWDLDGTQLASLSSAESSSRLLVVDVRNRQITREHGLPVGSQSVASLPDGKGWLVTRGLGDRGSEVIYVEPSGRSTVIWQSRYQRLWRPIVSPDGRRVAFASGTVENAVWSIEHF